MPAAAATTRMKAPPPPQVAERNKKRRGSAAPLVLVFLGLLVLAALAWASYSLLQERQNVPNIAVPNLVDMNLDAARDMVGDDFDLTVTDSKDDESPVDTILSQNPSTGKAEKGSEISVTVVGTQVADVPYVVGSESAAAERELEAAGFEVKVNEERGASADEGKVTGQNPESECGRPVPRSITVGTGPRACPSLACTGRPGGGQVNTRGNRPPVGTTDRDYIDEVAKGVIFFQDPQKGGV